MGKASKRRNRKGEESREGARGRGQQEEKVVAVVVLIMEIKLIIITETILN
jgi:hypothetical protein